MAEKHFVVHGATCVCKHSETPQTDILKVKTQTKHFGNDKDGSKKLIATDKEIGQTLKKNTFGKCKLQPTSSGYLPCKAIITKWSNVYEKITFDENKGKILLEDSKATCPIGGPECISIKNHGQTAEIGEQNVKNSNPEVLTQLFSGVDFINQEKSVLHIIKETGDE
jgi:hypothetical protein